MRDMQNKPILLNSNFVTKTVVKRIILFKIHCAALSSISDFLTD